jgi:hypothetical protein
MQGNHIGLPLHQSLHIQSALLDETQFFLKAHSIVINTIKTTKARVRIENPRRVP